MDPKAAKAVAAQLRIVSEARDAVTSAELRAALTASEKHLLERLGETERRLIDRTAALVWRLFGAMVALAGVIIAAVKLIP